MGERNTQDLWNDYRFLTKEMIKFLNKPDMELFYNLLGQRERLQSIIEQSDDIDFKNSTFGKSLFEELQKDNLLIMEHLQSMRNRSKQYHQVSEAYNGINTVPKSRRNWER